MRTLAIMTAMGLTLSLGGCSTSDRGGGDDVGPCQGGTVCSAHEDCPRGQYCAPSDCCLDGCAFDEDCEAGERCDLDTHTCVTGGQDGGPDDGGQQDGGQQDGGQQDGGQQDGGGDQECPETHDRTLGQDCECDGQCAPEAPFCFADLMNDPGPTYCTIPDCTAGSCPESYLCNDFYTQADPPQPAFCQKCLGGPVDMGGDCLCDSDCDPAAPDCFKDLVDENATPACTITNCTVGDGDECPGTYECSVSFDMAGQAAVNYCKACDPGDHSLAEGAECGCTLDCPVGAVCTTDSLQNPKTCVMCLGGEPRGFGEDCECDSDCGPEFPNCLPSGGYCSIFGCAEDPNLCPEGATCQDMYIFSFCKRL